MCVSLCVPFIGTIHSGGNIMIDLGRVSKETKGREGPWSDNPCELVWGYMVTRHCP